MRIDLFYLIVNLCVSYLSRTELTFSQGNLMVTLLRRNSPYVSRRKIHFGETDLTFAGNSLVFYGNDDMMPEMIVTPFADGMALDYMKRQWGDKYEVFSELFPIAVLNPLVSHLADEARIVNRPWNDNAGFVCITFARIKYQYRGDGDTDTLPTNVMQTKPLPVSAVVE